ncbi:MAG: hypothetical protein KatS3mg044_0802 [Rhodothermaceae bacterium]|nr:MAG: hypothetical protein KatS3mg044_0802 [Rhodothermaceae bacterium]
MPLRFVRHATALLLTIIVLLPARGQHVDISGLAFGDVYWLAAHDEASLENRNGLWFRRVYLTFDVAFDDAWSARLRTEMNSAGDFESDDQLVPFAKDLYVRWRGGTHQIYLGLSPTPTWNVVEGFWGYRAVEKTLVDLQRLGSSRDMGVAVRGRLRDGRLHYHAMIGNGSGTRTETNKGKKAMLGISLHPSDRFVLEVYGDADDRPGQNNRFTLQGFAGYRTEAGRLGVQYVYQKREVQNGADIEIRGLSVFGAARLSERVNAFARFDRMFDSNPDAGRIAYLPFFATGRSNLILAGLDIAAHDQVHVMPNVEVVVYDETNGDPTPDPTIMPRLTFFFWF